MTEGADKAEVFKRATMRRIAAVLFMVIVVVFVEDEFLVKIGMMLSSSDFRL
jgi:hypothetical protein